MQCPGPTLGQRRASFVQAEGSAERGGRGEGGHVCVLSGPSGGPPTPTFLRSLLLAPGVAGSRSFSILTPLACRVHRTPRGPLPSRAPFPAHRELPPSTDKVFLPSPSHRSPRPRPGSAQPTHFRCQTAPGPPSPATSYWSKVGLGLEAAGAGAPASSVRQRLWPRVSPSNSCKPVSQTACWFYERPVSFIYYPLTMGPFPDFNKFLSCSGWKVRVFSEARGSGRIGHRQSRDLGWGRFFESCVGAAAGSSPGMAPGVNWGPFVPGSWPNFRAWNMEEHTVPPWGEGLGPPQCLWERQGLGWPGK